MLMKKIGIYLSAVVMLAISAACAKNEAIEGNGHGFDEATFKVEATSVENTKATFTITSTGATGATYFGFLTNDMESKASDLIASVLKGVNVTRHMLSSGKTTDTVEGLRQGGKQYRYIVTGLLANGATYNEPVMATIETPGDYKTGSLNVSVAQITAQAPVFSITGVEEMAAYAVVSKESAAALASEKVLFNTLLDEYDKLKVIDADKEDCKWSKLNPGDYVVYVIGLEEDEEAIEGFEPTLTYAKAEFTVEPIIEPEEEYLAYIGTWYDEKGNEYTLTQDVVNASYVMKGLDVDIPVLYENKGIKFSAEEKLGSTTEGYSIYLFGLDQEGYAEDASQNDDDPYILATGAMEDNKIAIAGSEYEAIYDGNSYDEVIVGLIVYGVDESNNKLYRLAETPAVLSLPASLSKDKPGVEDVYSKFIGNWAITRGEATDTWIISAKEEGKSFNIDGVEGLSGEESITIEGKFENGKLVVYTQTLGSWTHSSYGTVEDHLMGNVVYDEKKYRINGDYLLFTGTLSADGKTIEMTPGTVTVESLGGELTLVGLQFYGVLTDEGDYKGAALYYNADYTTLPNTLTKEGGVEEDVYSKFIGNWTITRGEATDTWIISAKEEGKSFNIDGVEGFSGEESITIEGKFEDDKLVVYAQTLNSWTHKSYGTVENHLMGNVVVDENKYRINGDYALFAGTLSADGKTIEMIPGTVTVESLGGELTLAGLQFYGVLTDEGPNKGAALYYNADYTTLPNTLTASTESPSSVSVSKQAVAIMGTPALNSSTTIRTFSFAGDKTKGNLEKSSAVKAEKKDKASAPKGRGTKKTTRESKTSSIIAGHKA